LKASHTIDAGTLNRAGELVLRRHPALEGRDDGFLRSARDRDAEVDVADTLAGRRAHHVARQEVVPLAGQLRLVRIRLGLLNRHDNLRSGA
jgi:hypothetical protein